MKNILKNFAIAYVIIGLAGNSALPIFAQSYNDGSWDTGSYYNGSWDTGSYTGGYNNGSWDTGSYYNGSWDTGSYPTYNTGSWDTTTYTPGYIYTPDYSYTNPSYYTPTYTEPTYYAPTYTGSYYTPTNVYYPPTNVYYPPTNVYTPPANVYYPPTNVYYPPTNTYIPPVVACPQDAQICPNGSTVGRTGPNCSFAQCPTVIPPTTPACITQGILPSPLPPNYNANAVTNAPCRCPAGNILSSNGLTCTSTPVPPSTKTCPNGTVVNISDICYRTCPNGTTIPEGQSCPIVCADGTQAINGLCYRTCTDGSRIPESQSCPTPNRVCPDGSVVPSNQACPTRVCSNGTTVPLNQVCYRTCSNGTTVPETSICYRTCPNGGTVPETNLCPTQTQTCWDGSIIPVTSVCPNQYKVCPNGTSVPINQSCNRICANGNVVLDGQSCYRTCPNGASIPEGQSCPVVVGFPWVDLSIDRSSVPYGGSATLSWTSQNTSSCVATNGWSGARALQGSEPRYNITSGVTYTITCYSPNGTSVSDSVSVTTASQTIKVNNVITSIPTEITETSARCNGIGLIANNANSNAWFEYGETSNLGRTTATANIGSAATSPFSNVLASLKPKTTYYCRAVMANSNGTVKGDIVSFTTKAKKTVYVKPVIKTTTTVKKTVVKSKEIICSDGSTVTVKNSSNAQILSTGGKLVEMQLEKQNGDLSQGGEVTYRLSYRNTSESTLKNVVFKVTIPQEFTVLTASAGAYDKTTRTLTVAMLSIPSGAQGEIMWTVKVANDAQIGKTVVTPAVVSYVVPGTEGDNEVQDEVTAYVMGTITPANTTSTTTETVVKKTSYSFLPKSLIEWLALFAILLIIMILARSAFVSWRGSRTTH